MSNLIKQEKLEKFTGLDETSLEVIKNSVAKGASNHELAYFLKVSEESGLSPFKKEVWCYKDNKGNQIIFPSIDGWRKLAKRDSTFRGVSVSEVCKNDKFSIDIPNGQVDHKFNPIQNRGDIVGAYAMARIEGQVPTVVWVDIKDYDKKQFTWNSHKADMIKKTAEMKAYKQAIESSGFQVMEDFNVNEDKGTVTAIKTGNRNKAKGVFDKMKEQQEVVEYEEVVDVKDLVAESKDNPMIWFELSEEAYNELSHSARKSMLLSAIVSLDKDAGKAIMKAYKVENAKSLTDGNLDEIEMYANAMKEQGKTFSELAKENGIG